MDFNEMYKVISIENNNEKLKEYLLTKHYLKRLPSAMYSFALLDINENIIGVCTFSLPSYPLCKKFDWRIIELSRLYILDITPKNTESWFIARCITHILNLHNYDFIVSFADTSVGHQGTIYKASNFINTGKTKRQLDYKLIGEDNKHPRGVLKNKSVKEIQEIYGAENLIKVERSIKIRFFKELNMKRKKAIRILKEKGYKIE